jgi:hypothetical protein
MDRRHREPVPLQTFLEYEGSHAGQPGKLDLAIADVRDPFKRAVRVVGEKVPDGPKLQAGKPRARLR